MTISSAWGSSSRIMELKYCLEADESKNRNLGGDPRTKTSILLLETQQLEIIRKCL